MTCIEMCLRKSQIGITHELVFVKYSFSKHLFKYAFSS